MCGDYITSETDDNQDECPADGVYDFAMPYVLPSEETSSSWIATGWSGTGDIFVYSEANNPDSMIGHCQLIFSTSVTPSTGDSVLSKFPVPSAMITSFVLLAFVSFLVLSCIYRTVRDINSKKYKEKKSRKGDQRDDDETTLDGTTTSFVQMKD